MKKVTIILLTSLAANYCFGQFVDPSQHKVILYPVNVYYLFINRYQPSVQVKVGRLDHLLVGLQFNTNNNFSSTNFKGSGYEFQYRINMNRDPNLAFRSFFYWAPFFHHYWASYESTGTNYNYWSKDKEVFIGLLVGNTVGIGKILVFDLYFGVFNRV